MTPEEIDALQLLAGDIAKPLNEYLIADICRRVKKAGAITDTAEYQIYRAEALGMARDAIAKAVAKQMGASEQAISALLETLADKTVSFQDSGVLQQLVAAYAKITTKGTSDILKDLWAPGPDKKMYTVDEIYGRCMDFAFGKVMTGATDADTAIRQATRDLANRGIRTLANGKNGGTVSIEYATRRYVLNRMGALHTEIQNQNHDKMGADGWELSAHGGSAPDHEPYQGRQYSDKDYAGLNNSLERKIGTWQCKHIAYPIVLGKSDALYTDAQLQDLTDRNAAGVIYDGHHFTLYQAEQERAAIESALRRDKLRCLADDALGDKDQLQIDQIKLNRLNEEYVRFCKGTGQKTRSERVAVAGFGRSEAARARWAEKKTTENYRFTRGAKVFASSKGKTTRTILGLIDPSNPIACEKYISDFCNTYAKSQYEHMLVISKSGKVYYVTDESAYGIDSEYLANEMNGSYNIHTHPKDTTQYSFSTDADMPGFFHDGSAVMEAIDHKYRYRFERADVTWAQWDKARYDVSQKMGAIMKNQGYSFDEEKVYRENIQHVLMKEICKTLGISDSYRRWSID